MLKKGIYDNIISRKTQQAIRQAESEGMYCQQQPMDTAESPQILAEYLAKAIKLKLEDTEDQHDRVRLVNRILRDAGLIDDTQISNPTDLLTEVMTSREHITKSQTHSETPRPVSGFRTSNLFTGGNSTLPLGEEIRREIASSDEICFIVSFLRVSGLRILMDDLRKFCSREGTRLRIITTTYCGATEPKALKLLSELPNTEIRISYNTETERLHAKSYIFLRNSGMNTAYIGSSNLSRSAHTDGLEWNIRVTSAENPHIIKTALATFDLYWNSPNFEDFQIGGMDKFYREIRKNIFRPKETTIIRQYNILPHQKQILDKLKAERETNGNYRNLIVAATGTGKTVISAFDYLNFRRENKGKCRILFTAHREEILRQSLDTYRSVLADANFGALWTGHESPREESEFEYLFVSVAMFNSRFESFFSKLEAEYFDYIVIDEAHHSQADSYRRLFTHFNPKILIGLTATPERMDGRSLCPDFGGHISAEIRLPNALQAGLLTPFQYLCISDNTDLSEDALWNGNKFNTERLADKLINISRASLIADKLHEHLSDEYTCKALCFCVNKRHADFMAEQLCKNGFNAKSLTSDTPSDERKKLASQLREGSVNYLCVVDIFNEGVDIPEIDTVLFLRPTESLTIFLQQLGRGLRLSVGKTELTVLDFVSKANRRFDFASKFRALTTNPSKNIAHQIKEGFTVLPFGCNIIMEQKARQYILDNITSAIYTKTRLVRELSAYTSAPTISEFLESNGQDIRILYQSNKCWSSLKREAGLTSYIDDSITRRLEKGTGKLIHHNTASFLKYILNFLHTKDASSNEQYALMLYYALFQAKVSDTEFRNIYEALNTIFLPEYQCFRQEIEEIALYLSKNIQLMTEPLGEPFCPQLELYGCYTREEIFILTGRQTASRKMSGSASGVFNLPEHNATLLFVTLNKSDKDFSPTTQYNDYIINEDHFHWQSQNTDSHTNKGGDRYTRQSARDSKIILFVREEKKDGFGNTSPFHCFGLVDYESSHGDFPMNVTWKLHNSIMPQYLRAV